MGRRPPRDVGLMLLPPCPPAGPGGACSSLPARILPRVPRVRAAGGGRVQVPGRRSAGRARGQGGPGGRLPHARQTGPRHHPTAANPGLPCPSERLNSLCSLELICSGDNQLVPKNKSLFRTQVTTTRWFLHVGLGCQSQLYRVTLQMHLLASLCLQKIQWVRVEPPCLRPAECTP